MLRLPEAEGQRKRAFDSLKLFTNVWLKICGEPYLLLHLYRA